MKNEIKIMKEGSNWTEAYPILSKVINEKNLKTGVEIGVAYGGHAEYILSHTKVEKLYGIDPYKHIWGYDDPMNFSPSKFNKLCESMLSRLSPFKDRFSLIKKKSKNAVNDIKEKLDFVYIDADHSYQGVKEDISRWFDKIKNNGIIAGHDYNHPNFPGVKKAVDEFAEQFNCKIDYDKSGVWWAEKKEVPISFIIPAFNCSKTIVESVDSILDTNFEEGDEIVIVDDKSTDNTLEIIEKLSFKNPSVKIIKHLSNQGGGATRNTAVKNSKNDLIFCLDSDNVLEKNSIGKLKSFLVSNKSDVASFGRLKFFKENTKKITHQWKFKDGLISMPDIFCSPIIPSSSGNYLFTKKSWVDADGYPEKSGALDTWGFGFRQLANDAKMITMPNSYYFHRHGHDSYWIRESRNGKISLIATEIIKPYFNLIDKDILSYIKNNPNKWFDNLGNIPNTNCINTGKVILSYKEIIGNKLKRFSYVVSVFKRIFIKINSFIKNLLKEEKEDLQQKRAFPWFNTNGDKTLRLNYPLTSSSVVVDVGGYEGQWASDIFSKYCCNIIIFEPVKEFYVKIKDRFIKNDKIVVYELGLAGSDRDIKISLLNDSSSLFKNDSKSEDIKVVSASSFFNKHNINNIDLIKINIEGSEYDLLENLIKSNFITKIKNIQVQFHDFVPGAKERMIKIQEQLGKTHHLTYQYEFIWENWERNN